MTGKKYQQIIPKHHLYYPGTTAVGNESELQSKLRVFHERKQLAVIEEALAPVTTGRSLTADTVPAGVSEAVRRFWDADSEPSDLIADETGEPELAVWMEEQLARHGIGRDCYVATGLSIKPWIGCAQTPGWTRVLRTVLPDPVAARTRLRTPAVVPTYMSRVTR